MAKCVLAAASLVAAGWLSAPGWAAADRWDVAALLAGDSDLWQVSRRVWAGLVGAPGVRVVALLDGPPGTAAPALLRLDGHRRALKVIGECNTGAPECLSGLVRDVGRGGRRMVVLVGHGEPPVVAGMDAGLARPGGIAADWTAGDVLLPHELAMGLGPGRWDVAVLAACHSASMEMLWALRDKVRYAVACAGEVALDGRRLGAAITQSVSRHISAVEVAKGMASVLAREGNGQAGVQRGAAVVVDMAKFRRVAEGMRAVAACGMDNPAVWRGAFEAVGGVIAVWDEAGVVTDVGALCGELARVLPPGVGAQVAGQVSVMAEEAIIWRKWLGMRPDGAVGIEIARPSAHLMEAARNTKAVCFWQWSGWRELAEALYGAG